MTRPHALACLLVLALCRAAAGTLEFKITDAKGQPVADAVVSLVPLDAPAPSSPRDPTVQIEQKSREFLPYVTAVRTGTSVMFPNNDTVEHFIYSQSDAKKISLPLYKPGKTETIVFDKPGEVVIGCDIHDSMIAYVIVLDTPWFAITPASGQTTLRDLPPGRYRADLWQPRMPKTESGVIKIESREVVVAAEVPPASLTVTLALGPDRRIRRTPETKNSGYR